MRVKGLLLAAAFTLIPFAASAQVGPCGSGDTCASGQVCIGPGGSRLCYRTCNPAAAAGASDACPASEACSRPSGFTQDVCQPSSSTGSSPAASAEPTEEIPFVPITPELGVPIPGGSLTAPTRESGVVRVAFLAEYINAAYRYLSTIALVVAIVMVVYGGFLYLGASAGVGSIQRGKKIIIDAIAGMLLILSAYAVLNLINPQTTNLKVLELAFVNPLTDEQMEELEADLAEPSSPSSGGGGGSSEFITVDESNLERLDETCVHLNTPVDPSLIEPLRRAANRFCELRGSNTSWRIVGGGFRPPSLSLRLWLKRCVGRVNCTTATGAPLRPGVTTRDAGGRWSFADSSLRALIPPPQDAIYSDAQIQPLYDRLLPQAGASSGSGHARGLAMDIYCGGVSRNQADPFVPCQLLLEQAMQESGFCRIPNEWWHFELASNHPSRSCNPRWTIGTAMVPLGDAAAREVDYRSCTSYYSFSRARAGLEACH